MKRKYSLVVLVILLLINNVKAQDSKEQFQNKASTFFQKGDFDNAIQTLDQALLNYPNDVDLMKDEVYYCYLNRDYSKALDIGKSLLQQPKADEQAYQLAGLNYKAIADFKGADKLYKEGLKKFPKSGILYSEYGEMFSSDKNEEAAIKQWEKGIQFDPSISSNYYFASKYYAKTGNILWGLLYAEIFINTESLTPRTNEIKELLVNGYKKIIENRDNINSLKTSGSSFERALLDCYNLSAQSATDDISTNAIIAFRSRFIIHWQNKYLTDFPYKLFDYEKMLMQEGYYDSYNQWIFGTSIDKNTFQNWSSFHATDIFAFKQFQRSYLFKMPVEQYYGH